LTELFDTHIEVSSLTQAGHTKVRQQQTPDALAAQFQLEFMFTPGSQLADGMRTFLNERATLRIRFLTTKLHTVADAITQAATGTPTRAPSRTPGSGRQGLASGQA